MTKTLSCKLDRERREKDELEARLLIEQGQVRREEKEEKHMRPSSSLAYYVNLSTYIMASLTSRPPKFIGARIEEDVERGRLPHSTAQGRSRDSKGPRAAFQARRS